MGIDIYLRHKDMTKEDIEKQYTGFSIEAGDRGYLREAYGSKWYATEVLVGEAFEEGEYPENMTPEEEEWFGYVHIPAATLRERLPAALETVTKRYGADTFAEEMAHKSFREFVELAERWEAEGKHPLVYASY